MRNRIDKLLNDIQINSTHKGKVMKYIDKQWHVVTGEWCWYGFELVQVIDVQPSHIKICRQQSGAYEKVLETGLEPFMGVLPSFIKDS